MSDKVKPHAGHTTLRACILKKGKALTEEQTLKLGIDVADAHHLLYGNRPRKMEVVENGEIMFIAFYPKNFVKIINNLIDQA